MNLKRTTTKLMEKGKTIGLIGNEGKTKYTVVTRHDCDTRNLEVNNHFFERVTSFKHLGLDINEYADSHEEIRLRLIVANKCYFGLVPLFKSKLLSWKTKVTVQSPGETGSTITLVVHGQQQRRMTFERKVL